MGLIVYTGGTFDVFHAGHVNLLRRCAELGEVTVALNTDAFIMQYKGSVPVLNYDERKEVLEACVYVSSVIPNEDGADSKPTILKVKPNIIAIGSDWANKDYYKQMNFTQDWLDEQNISLIYIPYSKGISSTRIKKRL
jgi:glycerol-3-phosphate cytidylyltransferase